MSNTVLVPVYVSHWPGPWACDQTAAPKADDQAWDVEWGSIGQYAMPRPVCYGGYSGYKAVMVSAGPSREMYGAQYQGAACRSVSPLSQSQISTDDVSSDAMQSGTSASVGDSYEPPVPRKNATGGTHAGRRTAAAPESEAVHPPPKPQMEWRRSVGSAGHEEGLCKRCAFYSKGRCRNGDDCTHCHLNHEHRRSRHRRRHEQASEEASAECADMDDGVEELDDLEQVDAMKMDSGISKELDSEASSKPLGWSPVLPSNTPMDSTLVFGTVTPMSAVKEPQHQPVEAVASTGPLAPTSSSTEAEDGAFDTLLRGQHRTSH